MSGIKTFREIVAWQKAHELVLEVYKVTKSFPLDERFRLVDQICRAGISVPANIAEGFKRPTKNDSVHFYYIALASLEEVKYHLLLAKDLTYVDVKIYERLLATADECGRLLHTWLKVQK